MRYKCECCNRPSSKEICVHLLRPERHFVRLVRPERHWCVWCVPRLVATALAPESSVYILYAVYLGTHGTQNLFLLMKGRVSGPVSGRKRSLALLRYSISWRCCVVPIWYYHSLLAKGLRVWYSCSFFSCGKTSCASHGGLSGELERLYL